MTSSLSAWSEKDLHEFRAKAAPWHKNFINKLEEYLCAHSILMLLPVVALIFLCLAVVEPTQDPMTRLVQMLVIFYVIFFSFKLLLQWKVAPPQWARQSILDMEDEWDMFIAADHPLRQTIRNQRALYPEAEFELEWLDRPAPEGDELPRHFILWMSSSPFESADKVAILVMDGGEAASPPGINAPA